MHSGNRLKVVLHADGHWQESLDRGWRHYNRQLGKNDPPLGGANANPFNFIIISYTFDYNYVGVRCCRLSCLRHFFFRFQMPFRRKKVKMFCLCTRCKTLALNIQFGLVRLSCKDLKSDWKNGKPENSIRFAQLTFFGEDGGSSAGMCSELALASIA